MSVELSGAPRETKSVAGVDSHGKTTGKAGGAKAAGTNGFAALMNSLVATEESGETPAAGLLLLLDPLEKKSSAGNTSVMSAEQLFPVVPLVSSTSDGALVPGNDLTTESVSPLSASAADTPLVKLLTGGAPPSFQDPLTLPGAPIVLNGASLDASLGKLLNGGASPSFQDPLTLTGAPVVLDGASLDASKSQAKTAGAGRSITSSKSSMDPALIPNNGILQAQGAISTNGEGAGAAGGVLGTFAAHALLMQRSALQAQSHSPQHYQFGHAEESALSSSTIGALDAAATWAVVQGDSLNRPGSRFGSRSTGGPSGASSTDGAFSNMMASTNRTDVVFEVPQTSEVISDAAVAETVSYWASHGVQTAELKLEGFGDATVEVSILLNGDQAQIDFRSDQVDVRRVLEDATVQLKEMLSSEGLQLASVSVGLSGSGGGTAGEQRQRPESKQITLVKSEQASIVIPRSANTGVGRNLDLFV